MQNASVLNGNIVSLFYQQWETPENFKSTLENIFSFKNAYFRSNSSNAKFVYDSNSRNLKRLEE